MTQVSFFELFFVGLPSPLFGRISNARWDWFFPLVLKYFFEIFGKSDITSCFCWSFICVQTKTARAGNICNNCTVIIFRPVFRLEMPPRIIVVRREVGFSTSRRMTDMDRYPHVEPVFCYCWGLWTVVIWPKTVGNMCTWENTELWGEAAKKAGVLTWSSFRLNSEF